MAATPQPSTVTYQDLTDLEADFTDFDAELLRFQALHQRSLYDRRASLVRRIPNFWPLVLEQAPPEIDQYIQPSDAAVLLSALEDVEVSRFEVEEPSSSSLPAGDPRSIAFRFTFAPNDVFEDRVLEKRFWYRWAPRPNLQGTKKKSDREDSGGSNWSGLVSEPVRIRWKRGRDPTGGLLDLAVQVWEKEEGEGVDACGKGDKEFSADDPRVALRDALDKTAVGGISFFAWFGYVGRRVSAQTSQAAAAEDRARRAARAERAAARLAAGAALEDQADDEDDADSDNNDDDDEDNENAYPYEIFPDGEELAVMLAEDLWPNAIKYFKEAQEQDDEASDDDFESGSEDAEPARPPSKKQRT